MPNDKPLPAIPTASPLPTVLTIEARRHRLRFIRQVLREDASDSIPENAKETWAQCIEEALDELSASMTRGGWLGGIKQGRELLAHRRVAQQKALAQDAQEASKRPKKSASQKTGSPDIPSSESHSKLTLNQVKDLVAQSHTPAPKSVAKHLLLCVAPLGSKLAVSRTAGIALPTSASCKFSNSVFTLPDEGQSTILLGLDGWDNIISPNEGPTRLVGGTFSFVGVTSLTQHAVLSKALRVATYVHLSLILEQHFLSSSHVQLHFPKPRVASTHRSFQSHQTTHQEDAKSRQQRTSFLPTPGGILSYLSKKAGLYRSNSSTSVPSRGTSLDLGRPPIVEDSSTAPVDTSSTPVRRFSFVNDVRPSFLKPTSPKPGPELPFATIVHNIEQCKELYSTSTGVVVKSPSLIVGLAEKEKQYPDRKLKGDERTGLSSILGWDGKESRGRGMSGTPGFVRHQGISALYSLYVPSNDATTTLSSSETTSLSRASLVIPDSRPSLIACGQPRWVSYRYYSREQSLDKCLGAAITEWVSCAGLHCSENSQCKFKRGEHEMRFIHGGVCIAVKVQQAEEDAPWRDDAIEMWQSCSICGAQTKQTTMSDGTYLFSFAKFIELLVYSPEIHRLHPTLCEHTTTSPPSHSVMSRLNILRHFRRGSGTVSFSLTAIDEIFELKVPRLQILRMYGEKVPKESPTNAMKMSPGMVSTIEEVEERSAEAEKRALRREIKTWWEGVADHIDKLEGVFNGEDPNAFRKALPRLPSSDDPFDDDMDDVDVATPTKATITGLPISLTPLSFPQSSSNDYFTPHHAHSISANSSSSTQTISATTINATPTHAPSADPAELLVKLRHTFQRIEQSLYSQLSRSPLSSLNDVRRSFLCASMGASKRLAAWQQKHLPADVAEAVGSTVLSVEPEWWAKGCHAVPGSNVVVRENDWGSIIAFTLGTADYQHELASMALPRSARAQPSSPASTSPSTSTSTGTSFFSPSRGFRFFTSSTQSRPDPDQEDVVWYEPESFSSVISRKEHPKDATYLLSIREVLRQRAAVDGPSTLSPSRFAPSPGQGPASSKSANGAPPSAWAKPDVQVSMEAADGIVSCLPENAESAGRILQEIESAEISRPGSAMSVGSGSLEGYIRRRKSGSTLSVSTKSDITIGKEKSSPEESALPPEVPPKELEGSHLGVEHGTTASGAPGPIPSTHSNASFSSAFSSGLGYAMRLITTQVEQEKPNLPPKGPHGLLSTDGIYIDDKPHIKFDWTVGKRLKFSCTAYYAKQFDLLRRRCGIENWFLHSLSRSANWAAEGGKSRANFWKTSDDRLIIKTLVNAWNVADLQVLLELAPSYFRYMDTTAKRATVLAKLLGFYTIEIRNLETGTVQARADLLVMENLFYSHKIVKTFDLKGIQGRKIKPGDDGPHHSKTLFDGEWIEGQQRTLTLVQPHSKAILREAIRNDAEFLAKSNIMDYSLLLGVDEENKQIACGLVDTIGSYTFAKTLEYKAKQGLNSGKEVTVIPPAEYQERFVNALERYFLPCPDKWSQPMDGVKVSGDPNSLPSVL
ncbi:PIPK domain-containing protein [Pleurotus pulmonarius]